ncbi:hypothetical protein BGZ61DRAFT_590681 [Ilyonectria robusta]|uniref:uncharacterized protein n=1 Tax=Ilyonectria robusta TaxID=1079257 RepID=UPI001E8E7C02|nr:uncharacterized protein BGZ61DRAFT_590681 [Ilyonectria robusta]KAH8680400.1 hypothetical protein BGZ61DRAFT_590681 [Ilyonectria robusta]
MATKSIERVCIIGATGRIGGAFAEALLKTGKHTVTALTRADSKGQLPEGIKAVKVDYDDEASIVEALKGQQFLVITLSVTAPQDLHGRIVVAAAKAGVPMVMPNAYGYPMDRKNMDAEDTFAAGLLSKIEEAERLGLSTFTLSCGFWYEWSLALGEQWFGFTIKDQKVTMFDDGKRVVTVSTWEQCGRALAGFLSLPESGASPCVGDYTNSNILINSFQVSQRDMLDSLHRVLGTSDSDWDITYESVEKRMQDGTEELKKGMMTGFAKVLYARGFDAANKNRDYAATSSMANGILGLPKEDLDEATKRAVDMVRSGWTPFA